MDYFKEAGHIAGFAGLSLVVFLWLMRKTLGKTIVSKIPPKDIKYIVIPFMLLVTIFSIFSIYMHYHTANQSFGIVVIAHGEQGFNQVFAGNRAKVKLIEPDQSQTINDEGTARFTQIPGRFFGSDTSVKIQFYDPGGDDYGAMYPDSLYTLTNGGTISLFVRLFHIDTLRGRTTNFATRKPVDSVLVTILGDSAYSNSHGEFALPIPKRLQHQYQTVHAYKIGYEPYDRNNVPIHSDSSMPIVLKPAQK